LLGIDAVLLLVTGMAFSLLLYGGEFIPWWLSVLAGFLSFLFLTVLGLNWLGKSDMPEAGILYILWGVVNLMLGVVIVVGALRGPKKVHDTLQIG
jgi:hypothetical protein